MDAFCPKYAAFAAGGRLPATLERLARALPCRNSPDYGRSFAQTFRDAGYRVASEYEDGVLVLEFPITPTDTAPFAASPAVA